MNNLANSTGKVGPWGIITMFTRARRFFPTQARLTPSIPYSTEGNYNIMIHLRLCTLNGLPSFKFTHKKKNLDAALFLTVYDYDVNISTKLDIILHQFNPVYKLTSQSWRSFSVRYFHIRTHLPVDSFLWDFQFKMLYAFRKPIINNTITVISSNCRITAILESKVTAMTSITGMVFKFTFSKIV